MLQLDEREFLRGAVIEHLTALESLCGTLETALMRRRWSDLDAAIADSRRLTHGLQNAMYDAREARDEFFDAEIFRRIRYLHSVRQNQMARLQQFNDAVGERLQLLSRWKSALRSMSTPQRPKSRLASLDQLS